MDVLAIILACSLHPDDELVRTLVDVQSNANIYFVGDLATLKTNDSLKSAEGALRFAEDLRQHGGRPAVGLLGVPLEWASRYGRAPIELFDACTNVAVATAAFAAYYDRCSSVPAPRVHPPVAASRRHHRRPADPKELRYCVVSRFARDLGLTSASSAVLRRLISERGTLPGEGDDAPAQRSSIFGNDSEDAPSGSAPAIRPRIFLEGTAKASTPR
jgi:hypothetical protein